MGFSATALLKLLGSTLLQSRPEQEILTQRVMPEAALTYRRVGV